MADDQQKKDQAQGSPEGQGGDGGKGSQPKEAPQAATRPAPPKPSPRPRPDPKAGPTGPEAALLQRRKVVWLTLSVFLAGLFAAVARFFFPRTLFEPRTRFRIGYPAEFGFGVDTRHQSRHRIWVVRNVEGIFVISAICTHLGCTPDWIEGENKFKCPCHGSGFDSEGLNFEGPAPRPLDRCHVELDAEGQIVVDTSRLYIAAEFDREGAILRV